MLSLPELQTRMASALFGEATAPPPTWIRAAGIRPELRLGIYRNNLQEGFAKTLALEFPVMQRLVGEDYFRQLALSFLAHHPSRSGDLHHVGAPFAGFLREQFADTPYRYFADVAALEWALQECLVAEDDAAIDPHALQTVPPRAYPRLRLALRRAARLLESPFPIVRIWEANQPEAEPVGTIDLAAGPEFALAHRIAGSARISRLSAGEFALLSRLARAEPL
ncbi:MAG: putative DNA-binding domain-containing protein, partial [Gammaproteobacteria bacterium]|nr:putative DNA-binding domain-containing protein [Gammaproteobacteria bacterium]